MGRITTVGRQYVVVPFFCLGVLSLVPAVAAGQGCPPPQLSAARLRALPGEGFVVGDSLRMALAPALVACLADRDPVLRDEVAFTGLSTWMRGKLLPPAVVQAIGTRALALLQAPRDTAVFAQSFAALVLSEVVRADRVDSVLAPDLLAAIAREGQRHLGEIRDYRGFHPIEGWRHDLAHSADLLLQLGLNSRVPSTVLEGWLTAFAPHVDGRGTHVFLEGEPERLTRAVVNIARRGVVAPAFWDQWLARLGDPGPLGSWGRAFETPAGRIRRQNLLALLHAIDFTLRAAPFEGSDALRAPVDRELRRILSG